MKNFVMSDNSKRFLVKFAKIFLYVLAFFIPVAGLLHICKEAGMFPLGLESWLVCDMDNQYVAYFSYLKYAVQENGFFYTFSKTIGGDMLGFTAYYLVSPLNLLFLLVETVEIPKMVAWISLVKIGLSGLSGYALFNYESNNDESATLKRSLGNLIFSTAYALMTYNLIYISNIMWFDCIYVLPLVILGIQRVVNKKKYLLYVLSLAYAITTNFYIGYMICIFSAAYFVYYCICQYHGKLKDRIKPIALFIIGSLLAGGISMWLVLPAKTSLDGIKAGFSLAALTTDKKFWWSDFLVKLLPCSTEALLTGMPNVYCGIIILFFAAYFFFSRKICIKRKIGLLCLLGFMFLSFYISGLNLIWHGFNEPIGFPYRNSFLFSFVLIMAAKDGFFASENEKPVASIINSLIVGVAIIVLALWMQRKPFEFLTEHTYTLTFIMVAVAVVVSILNRKKIAYVVPVLGLVGLLYETGINGNDVFAIQDGMYETYVVMYADQIEPAVELIQEVDTGFYRIEKNFYRNTNDNMMFGMAGLSHYSSTQLPAAKRFMGKMGYRDNGNSAYYNRGSTLSAESFLGVKYLLSRKALEKPYKYVDKIDGTYIYENPYAFSMAFLTDGYFEEIDTTLDNTFDYQNIFFSQICDTEDIFHRVRDFSTTLYNVELVEDTAIYRKIDNTQEGYIEYSFTVEKDMPLYLYLNTTNMKPAEIYLNDVGADYYFLIKQYDALRIEDYIDLEVGDTLTIKVLPQMNEVVITDVLIYYEDHEELEKGYTYQKEGSIEFEKISDSYLKATFENVDNRGKILFSIPYNEGWKVYLDGKRVDTYQVAETFMAIDGVEVGTHTLTLKYVPKHLVLGCILSLLSLIILITIVYLDNKDDKDRILLKHTIRGISGLVVALLIFVLVVWIFNGKHSLKVMQKGVTQKQEETIVFGSFEQDGNPENGPEPIEWLVLEEKEGKALVISKYALNYLQYQKGGAVYLWENSYVREWLNDEFYSTAFSHQEQERIVLTTVDNSIAGSEFIAGGEATEDHIFVPCIQDVITYFGINATTRDSLFYSQAAICEPTKWALMQNDKYNLESYDFTQQTYDSVFENYGYTENVIGMQGCNYWLRNPGRYALVAAATVGGNGSIYDVGTYTTERSYVRPAMWIDMQ